MSQRNPMRWHSKFGRFVSACGVQLLAEKLQVHPTAIYQWLRDQTPDLEVCGLGLTGGRSSEASTKKVRLLSQALRMIAVTSSL